MIAAEKSSQPRTFQVTSPVSGAVLRELPNFSADEVSK